MFSGMPTFMSSLSPKNNMLAHLQPLGSLYISQPAGFFIFGMLGFYLLMVLLGVNPWLSLIGALMFGFSTNNYILYEAGHNSKIMTIMTSPLVIAGVLLLFRQQFLGGIAVFSVGLGLNLLANHPQMTYYLAMCIGILVVLEMVKSIKDKNSLAFCKAIGL
ncbi:MAG: hypothetical protein IPO37_04020 [Saprospiraceae bacterium]|nr:hypothetical protein [Saprospiraceae bacterium]